MIDLLVKAGYDEADTAGAMLEAGSAFSCGGRFELRAFTRDLGTIPANERVKRVLDEQLWDRRKRR